MENIDDAPLVGIIYVEKNTEHAVAFVVLFVSLVSDCVSICLDILSTKQ